VILYIFAALIYSLAKNPKLQWDVVGEYMFQPIILRAALVTIELTVIAMVVGAVGGTVLAVMRLSKNYVLSGLSWLYIWFFRGTPVYVQIIIWGFIGILYPKIFIGLPFTGLAFGGWEAQQVIGGIVAATLALGLNEAAYAAELVRAGIISVDKGQSEAAQSLGMSFPQTMRRIVLPQAMRVIIPPMGNETISMLKTTSLVAVTGAVPELMTQVTRLYSQNFKIMPLLIVASLWYIIFTTLFTIGQHYLERYFGRGFGSNETETAEKRAQKRLKQKVTADVSEPGNWD
jgi:polar amino acid transport system permease protein